MRGTVSPDRLSTRFHPTLSPPEPEKPGFAGRIGSGWNPIAEAGSVMEPEKPGFADRIGSGEVAGIRGPGCIRRSCAHPAWDTAETRLGKPDHAPPPAG